MAMNIKPPWPWHWCSYPSATIWMGHTLPQYLPFKMAWEEHSPRSNSTVCYSALHPKQCSLTPSKPQNSKSRMRLTEKSVDGSCFHYGTCIFFGYYSKSILRRREGWGRLIEWSLFCQVQNTICTHTILTREVIKIKLLHLNICQ